MATTETAPEPTAPRLALALHTETWKLDQIRREPELQCRARGINARTVAEYAEALKAGAVFPPVVVFRDSKGVLWLADGFHRVAAAERAGLAEVAADVREGDRKAALLHAAGANAEHGLRRTNADKRRAVQAVLAAFPKMSDRKIGEACGVDGKTVAAARKASAEIPHPAEPEPTGDAKPATAAPTPVDLAPIYVRVMQRHAESAPADHVRALVRALVQLHSELTPAQVVQYIDVSVVERELVAAAPVVPRRRIVQPRGGAMIANGSEP